MRPTPQAPRAHTCAGRPTCCTRRCWMTPSFSPVSSSPTPSVTDAPAVTLAIHLEPSALTVVVTDTGPERPPLVPSTPPPGQPHRTRPRHRRRISHPLGDHPAIRQPMQGRVVRPRPAPAATATRLTSQRRTAITELAARSARELGDHPGLTRLERRPRTRLRENRPTPPKERVRRRGVRTVGKTISDSRASIIARSASPMACDVKMLAVCPGCGGGGVGRHARSLPHGVTRRRRRAGPARCRRCSVHESRPSPPAGPMPTPRMCANAPAPRA